MRKLEQDLDILLFDRCGGRAVLTDAGRKRLHEGRHRLAAAGDWECRVRQVPKGRGVPAGLSRPNPPSTPGA